MSAQELAALAPYIVASVGLLVLLLLVSFVRGNRVALAGSVAVLLAVLAALLFCPAEPMLAMSFLRIDGVARFFNVLFVIAAIVTALTGHRYLAGRAGERDEFFILLLSATIGAMVLAGAANFAALLLGLEILSISLYVLIGYPEEGHWPLEAALKYLVLSGVASTTMLFGMALIYTGTGTMVFAELAAAEGLLPAMGQAMLLAGLAFKLSLVPFHLWTPDVYQGAPAPVTGYLATASKGAVFVVLLRYVTEAEALAAATANTLVVFFAVLSMVVGNLLALRQDNVKRILAYSSIAHLGYLMIGVLGLAALSDPRVALEASMVYVAGYFAMTLAAFAVVTVLSSAAEPADAESIAAYEGLFWRAPVAATVLTLAMLALAGVPLTVGFIAKFYLVAAGIEGSLWLLVWALVVGSATAIYYYLRVVITMTRASDGVTYRSPAVSAEGVAVLVSLGAVIVWLGVYPTPFVSAVRALLGG